MIRITAIAPLTSVALLAGAMSGGCDKQEDNESIQEAQQEAREAPKTMAPTPTPVNPPAAKHTLTEPKAEEADEPRAEADLKAADGQEIEGEVTFYETGNGIRVVANIEDAKPGKHGFHIHEKGDCSNIKAKSMGGHFSPEKHQHALPDESGERHLGDLGNIDVGDDGKGRIEATVEKANLKEDDSMSFVGKAVVVHMGEDSGKAKQPSGDSGTPIACGVIERT